MCVKLPLGDLNPNPYLSHSTNANTCEMANHYAKDTRWLK